MKTSLANVNMVKLVKIEIKVINIMYKYVNGIKNYDIHIARAVTIVAKALFPFLLST